MFEIIAAVGAAMTLEGAVYALFPAQMVSWQRLAITQPEYMARRFGLLTALCGVLIVWAVRGH